MHGLELLVLGSGGPFVQGKRASSCYVVVVGGRPRMLLDCGGGAFLRLGQAAPGQGPGREGFRTFFRTLTTAFPDAQLEPATVVADDDHASSRTP
jgi:hypothetical protein